VRGEFFDNLEVEGDQENATQHYERKEAHGKIQTEHPVLKQVQINHRAVGLFFDEDKNHQPGQGTREAYQNINILKTKVLSHGHSQGKTTKGDQQDKGPIIIKTLAGLPWRIGFKNFYSDNQGNKTDGQVNQEDPPPSCKPDNESSHARSQ